MGKYSSYNEYHDIGKGGKRHSSQVRKALKKHRCEVCRVDYEKGEKVIYLYGDHAAHERCVYGTIVVKKVQPTGALTAAL